MKVFSCPGCKQPVYFENVSCQQCGTLLAYHLSANQFVPLEAKRNIQASGAIVACRNRSEGVCNWTVFDSRTSDMCVACGMTQVVPNLSIAGALENWQRLEQAKRRVIYSVSRLKLPLKSKREDASGGLAFEFLSDETDRSDPVMTGHSDGLITINIDEADSATREMKRVQLRESYRTLVGHFRHEIGHYYWDRLVRDSGGTLENFRSIFGDERADYGEALSRYHNNGPPSNWSEHSVSAYSSAHPWEDWAETWAHYFHLVDALETGYSFNLQINPEGTGDLPWRVRCDFDPYLHDDIDAILDSSRLLSYAANSLNRSMGQPDLYPFVIPQKAIGKLRFVHEVIRNAADVA